MSNDLELDEWVAGFFNSEGAIRPGVKKSESNRLSHGINPNIEIKQTSKSFVSGLVDGDGCIRFDVNEGGKADETKHGLVPKFVMNQTGPGSVEEMIRLSVFCDSIQVSYSVAELNTSKEKWSDGYTFSISKRRDLKRFLNEIEDFLCFSKRNQVKILSGKIIPMLEDGKHTNKEGFLEIMAWTDLMNSFKGGNRGKYDLEYFENLWNMELSEEKKPDMGIEEVEIYEKETSKNIREW